MTTIAHTGFRFPEGARWHDGSLWFSDMHTGEVFRSTGGSARPELVAELDDYPSGLAWLPDGTLVVSSMKRRQVVRVNEDGTTDVHADLSGHTDAPINDMVFDPVSEQLFVGGFGYDLWGGADQRPGPVFAVGVDGAVSVACPDLVFPNGSVLLPGSRTLVVAETWGARLSAFTIDDAGALIERRVWADLPSGATPDGTCVDGEGGVWVSDINNGRFLRVVDGGEVTDTVAIGDRCATDCVLGGEDGRTLFLLTANSWQPPETEVREGRIETVRVGVAAALDDARA
jgi:sugar lactone lactonase YvrE